MATLQEGIFWQEKSTPGKHFGILFIRLSDDVDVAAAYDGLTGLWQMYQNLQKGVTSELPATPLPNSALTVTLGYGKNIFSKLQGVRQVLPQAMKQFGSLRSPNPAGGGEVLKGSGLQFSPKTFKNQATEDIVVQFTAETTLGINRAIVETWKYLTYTNKFAALGKFYTGFQREDRRSWIGFHDGIANLKSGKERQSVIEIKPGISADAWVEKGTYLCFFRIDIDLVIWNSLAQPEQELLVGRKKESGCPITVYDPVTKTATAAPGCPFSGTSQITERDATDELVNLPYFDAPLVADPLVRESHIQRANHHISPVSDRNSLRIFRQGYEFLEATDEYPGFSAGLNFVSFQDTPERVTRMLTQKTWLGSLNFGGSETDQFKSINQLLRVMAAGIYLIPPVSQPDKVPGWELFESVNK